MLSCLQRLGFQQSVRDSLGILWGLVPPDPYLPFSRRVSGTIFRAALRLREAAAGRYYLMRAVLLEANRTAFFSSKACRGQAPARHDS